MGEPSAEDAAGGWERFDPLRCDLCERIAKWRHPAGGLRCNHCPRPAKRHARTESPDAD